mmetsp:Transcript_4754/g.13311  ORF Transcript_4754/g.13311 Transcript_4754/m.13311 type:complete len:95 (+) Transcript_4754:1274-1558(+)
MIYQQQQQQQLWKDGKRRATLQRCQIVNAVPPSCDLLSSNQTRAQCRGWFHSNANSSCSACRESRSPLNKSISCCCCNVMDIDVDSRKSDKAGA